MESYIKLSTLNDYIFCPKSIYYHNIYDNYDKSTYQEEAQIAGTIAHESIDHKSYSTRKDVLMWLEVYSEYFGIAGKIDMFFQNEWKLIERKNRIEKIYLGYKYQLWGQMFCLEEMWYKVNSLSFHSIQDNKNYPINKPSTWEILGFEHFLKKYREYDLLQTNWIQNSEKCKRCIYRELCDFYGSSLYPQLSMFD